MDNHWAITTSSGRRVSLLCEEETDYSSYPYSYASSSAASSTSSPTPPLSPDFCRPYAQGRNNSIGSASSSTSSLNSCGLYSPRTPPNFSLPPLDKMVTVPEPNCFPSLASGGGSSLTTSPILASTVIADDSVSPTTIQPPTESSPSSPKSSSSNQVVKRTSRRYTCHCGKSFTTSGHLARHTRIHTGEKNYICPEAGCGARFSRQDNCMQHYRTHQSGSASKRAARRRRMSAECIVRGGQPETIIPEPMLHHARTHSYHAPQPLPFTHFSEHFNTNNGLTALANAAISGYP